VFLKVVFQGRHHQRSVMARTMTAMEQWMRRALRFALQMPNARQTSIATKQTYASIAPQTAQLERAAHQAVTAAITLMQKEHVYQTFAR